MEQWRSIPSSPVANNCIHADDVKRLPPASASHPYFFKPLLPMPEPCIYPHTQTHTSSASCCTSRCARSATPLFCLTADGFCEHTGGDTQKGSNERNGITPNVRSPAECDSARCWRTEGYNGTTRPNPDPDIMHSASSEHARVGQNTG